MNAAGSAPRRYALATWLSGGSLAIVLLCLTAMAVTSSLAVERLARRQALARAELAVSSVRDQFRRLAEQAVADARALGDAPALANQLREPVNALTLGIYLRNACGAARACALVRDGAVLSGTTSTDWPELAAARATQGERFALAPRGGGPPLLGAAAPVSARPGTEMWVLLALDDRRIAEAGQQAGATVRALNISTYQALDSDPMTPLHGQALAQATPVVARVEALASYAASVVVSNALGEPVALLDVQLPTAGFDHTASIYRRAVIAVTLLVAALAALAGALGARWIAAPVVRLASMARRIGQGDFSQAVPSVVPAELQSLAHAMDEMRQNLIELTHRLREREGEARSIIEGVAEGVFVTDDARVLRYANAQFLKVVGLPAEAVLGRFCGDLLHAGVPAEERPCARDCPILGARGGAAQRCAERLRLADGALRQVLVASAPPVAGRQVQLLRDETELEAARRARDSVLGNISHEFRTPLAAQMAAIELLREGISTLDSAQQLQLLANVERGGVRLMRLVDNLLESVRIESGQLAIRAQRVDLEAAAREAVAMLEPLFQQSGLGIEISLGGLHGRRIEGDAQRLQQVFVNLLANAIKFAPAGSTVRIGGQLLPRELEAWVEDEGPGLPAGDPAALFERFHRSAGDEPDAPGLGLGLWIVRSIVERHAGRVRAERTAQGRTRFVLSLPLDRQA
jgi:signal transduction histidine kinase/HAMP domain-containing protein